MSRILSILACPRCHGALERREDQGEVRLTCRACDVTASQRTGQLVFGGFTEQDVKADWLNRAKESAKRRLGKLYQPAIRVLAPVHMTGFLKPFLKSFDTQQQLVADLGCGTSDYDQQVACVDGVGYPNVHVVADLQELPFRSDSLDGIISLAVLEHVPDPAAHVEEFFRVLKPGGRALCYIPFMQGFHASPHDYQRYSQQGLRRLFSNFDVINVQVGAGPTSGMLWIVQEWLALVFSFGSERLYRLLMPLMWILSPIKFLDVLLVRHKAAHVIASAHVIEARKPMAPSKAE